MQSLRLGVFLNAALAPYVIWSGAIQKFVIAVVVTFVITPAFAQKLSVKKINRQDNETGYSYVVPGYTSSNSNTNVNCFGAANTSNCNGSTTMTGLQQTWSASVLSRTRSYVLASFAGRTSGGRQLRKQIFGAHGVLRGNHRSCRTPMVDEIEADFNGDKAKLKWPVSLDGKKMESETYKGIGVLAKAVSLAFTADSSSTTFEFLADSAYSSEYTGLDNVSVTSPSAAAVPEPGSQLLCGLGLAGLGLVSGRLRMRT